jgi:DNA-binding transcriptional MerR regulator
MVFPTIVVESTGTDVVLSIGKAARLAGVSVQTLRHYDKLGLLVPSQVSAAGYRRYSARDCERLRLIRALREVGFDLDTIGQVLDSGLEPDDAVKMRLEALEAEQRTLTRRQLLLRAAMKGTRKDVLERLQEKHVLARLDRLEREAFLERHLGWTPHDTPASEAIWRAAICDLPEEMDDAQLEAWLELAEIAADERFRSALERQFEFGRGSDDSRVHENFQRLLAHVVGAIRRQRDPDGEASRSLLDAWLNDLARLRSCTPDVELIQRLIDRLESSHDPRINRYWELICKLKRIPYDPVYARAFDWVLSALRARALPR